MPQGIKGMSESDPIYSYIYLLMNILPGLQVEKCKTILFYACFPQFAWTFWVARGLDISLLACWKQMLRILKERKIQEKKDKEIWRKGVLMTWWLCRSEDRISKLNEPNWRSLTLFHSCSKSTTWIETDVREMPKFCCDEFNLLESITAQKNTH